MECASAEPNPEYDENIKTKIKKIDRFLAI
jgi:hypothetical protein